MEGRCQEHGLWGGSMTWDCLYIAFKPEATPLTAPLTLLDVLPQKGGKVEMPFQFLVVDEGCSGSRQQSSTQKHASLENEGFQPCIKDREAQSPPSWYWQYLLKEMVPCTPCAFPLGWACAPRGPQVLNPASVPEAPG